MSKGWDSVMLKKLKSLMGKGLSTSEIGKRLGMSKNAVVGKLNRLGWNSKAGGVATADKSAAPSKKSGKAATGAKKSAKTVSGGKSAAKKTETAKTAVKKAAVSNAASSKKSSGGGKNLNKTLAMHQRIIQHSLEMANLKPNQCRWPIGDPDSEKFHFCGAPVFVGKPYCYEHCKQAYQFTPPKKK